MAGFLDSVGLLDDFGWFWLPPDSPTGWLCSGAGGLIGRHSQ
jgi:hypothetical protein